MYVTENRRADSGQNCTEGRRADADKIVPRVVIDGCHGSQQMSILTGVMGATKCLS